MQQIKLHAAVLVQCVCVVASWSVWGFNLPHGQYKLLAVASEPCLNSWSAWTPLLFAKALVIQVPYAVCSL